MTSDPTLVQVTNVSGQVLALNLGAAGYLSLFVLCALCCVSWASLFCASEFPTSIPHTLSLLSAALVACFVHRAFRSLRDDQFCDFIVERDENSFLRENL